MLRDVGLVGCVVVAFTAGGCGSGALSPGGGRSPGGQDAGPADAPLATETADALHADAAPLCAPPACRDAGADGGDVEPVAISAGLYSTCALLSNETVKCWGYNAYGQLGDDTTTASVKPVAVQGLNQAVAISASDGYHACAILADGRAQCWGSNLYGDFGNDTEVDSQTIKTVLNLNGIATISANSNYTCATLADGTAYCWGETPGGLGNSDTPTRLPLTGVVSVQAGSNDACAIEADGTVACFGDDAEGEIGNGMFTDVLHPLSTPTAVEGLTGVVALSAGTASECAVVKGGTVACWGDNNHGQLGNGAVITGSPYGSPTPVTVPGLTKVVAIATAGYFACAVLSDGSVRCWGDNEYGTLGNGTTTDSASPVLVPSLTNIVAISAGIEHACALAADGTVWCWGLNTYGELGHLSTTDQCGGAACSMIPVSVEW